MMQIPFISSNHHDARPAGVAVDLLVLHAISLPAGEFGMEYIEALFTGTLDITAHPDFESLQGLRVSSHFLVDRQGHITQFVPTEWRAWHAGISSWQERHGCNDYSIGIEMIGDEQQPFTTLQYRETARLCRVLMQHYPAIDQTRIVAHKDIAPDRKWDPGRCWDWQHFHRSLAHIKDLNLKLQLEGRA